MKNTFKKAERLSSKIAIAKLFENGRSFTTYPFRVIWLDYSTGTSYPAQIAFTVPKKNFKRAVDRNKLKRRAREAYRKNKYRLYEYLKQKNRSMVFMLVYTSKEEIDYDVIEVKINAVIDRLMREV
jgi:ribonuclease P protein component